MKQERTSGKQLFPWPTNGSLVEETPPTFCYLREEGVSAYTVTVQDQAGKVVWETSTSQNYAIPDFIFPAGKYLWNLSYQGESRGWWEFTISDHAVPFLRPHPEEIFASIPNCRPRHLFFAEDLPGIRVRKKTELETLRRNIALALSRLLPEPPLYHRDPSKPEYREYFGAYRDYCDRDLVACALGYVLLEDRQAGEKAKDLLLTICDWNPSGPCSVVYPWNDEIGLSNARCLPAVYDLLYPLLTEQQRYLTEQTIAAYARQCEERLIKLDFTGNPGNSHSGRIPAYLGEAAIVLKGSPWLDDAELLRWISLAMEIYGGIFPFFGTPDGGWAEGVFYASSYTKWYLPFFLAVERFSGFRFLDRPFYQRVSQFFLHFAPREWENHPFCDGYWCNSDDPEWPGFFAQNPFRIYGERFGPDLAAEWAHKYASPELFKLHLLDVFLPAGSPPSVHLTGETSPMAVFPEAGFASCHTNLRDQLHNTALLIRASKFGSISHQHADQGSFALIQNGKTMISPSGYFGRKYGTNHHQNWTNTTQAHNCILVDGVGQETNSPHPTGKFTAWKHEGANLFQIETDLSKAYPMLRSYRRTFCLSPEKLVIKDEIHSDTPCQISWLLHTLSKPQLSSDGSILVQRDTEAIRILPDYSFEKNVEITEKFAVDVNDGVPASVQVSMPNQYHITFRTTKKTDHVIHVIIDLQTPVVN
ncbi:MAG: heparinase II/III domain-containing protein [Candidatus Merdivicinus sp.]